VIRDALPPPELIIRICADEETIARRLSVRDRINIARAEDTALFNSLLDQWLVSLPSDQVLQVDVSRESLDYARSVDLILRRMQLSL
jgi:hypothetical protein